MGGQTRLCPPLPVFHNLFRHYLRTTQGFIFPSARRLNLFLSRQGFCGYFIKLLFSYLRYFLKKWGGWPPLVILKNILIISFPTRLVQDSAVKHSFSRLNFTRTVFWHAKQYIIRLTNVLAIFVIVVRSNLKISLFCSFFIVLF